MIQKEDKNIDELQKRVEIDLTLVENSIDEQDIKMRDFLSSHKNIQDYEAFVAERNDFGVQEDKHDDQEGVNPYGPVYINEVPEWQSNENKQDSETSEEQSRIEYSSVRKRKR